MDLLTYIFIHIGATRKFLMQNFIWFLRDTKVSVALSISYRYLLVVRDYVIATFAIQGKYVFLKINPWKIIFSIWYTLYRLLFILGDEIVNLASFFIQHLAHIKAGKICFFEI